VVALSEWLDIAIGVVLVWFLFSLVVSASNEAVVRVLGVRAKNLWQALNQMLDGEAKPRGLVPGVLSLLRKDDFRPDDPGHIRSVTQQLYATRTIQALEVNADPRQKTRIQHLPAAVFAQALLELGTHTPTDGEREIQGFLDSLPAGTPLKAQLTTLWKTAQGDLEKFRRSVEEWFDGQMQRVSAIYKSRVRIVLIAIGILISIAAYGFGLRSDSLALVSDLQGNADLRTAVATTASEATAADLVKLGGPNCGTPAECQLKGLRSFKELNGLDLSFGSARLARGTHGFWRRIGLIRHWEILLGVLITGTAISFGSTFWYDLLRRLVGLRGGST
jgi:hypothetical protein